MAGVLRFTPTEADFVAVQRDIYRQCLRTRRFRLIYGLIPVIGIVFGFADAGGVSWQFIIVALAISVAGAAAIAVVIGISLLAIPRASRRLFRQSKLLHQEFAYSWSDTGIRFSSANGSGDIPWEMLHGWLRTRSNLLLYSSPAMCHFLPLRLLRETEADDLQESAVRGGLKRL